MLALTSHASLHVNAQYPACGEPTGRQLRPPTAAPRQRCDRSDPHMADANIHICRDECVLVRVRIRLRTRRPDCDASGHRWSTEHPSYVWMRPVLNSAHLLP